jgi:hypothetical protein
MKSLSQAEKIPKTTKSPSSTTRTPSKRKKRSSSTEQAQEVPQQTTLATVIVITLLEIQILTFIFFSLSHYFKGSEQSFSRDCLFT